MATEQTDYNGAVADDLSQEDLGPEHLGDHEVSSEDFERIAVVGLAGHFPGADSVDELWQNLLAEKDGLHTFTAEELGDLGIPESITSKAGFVPRGSIINGYDTFDARRFGMTPREAAQTDPQARLFLETCHQALENAGYDPFGTTVSTGVFAGCNPVDYARLLGEPDYTDSLSAFDQMIGNDRDFLATRIAYRLGLTGPALNVQSACSTSLVAVHLAAQHLLEFQCDMAIAGGVSLNFRQGVGYFYQDGMILSPDGLCRAFDAGANGTTLGQGSGAVVLKRLSDALEDQDMVYAVIDGSAINNDGGTKMSYTAPSRAGQAIVIATAHSAAGIDSREVTYVETHGTGTNLGDPVEVEGLTRAFRLHTDDVGFCHLGSIKSSIGHLDAAAGIAGFIKAVLCVKHAKIPASLHFEDPNPAIDFANSPFVVASSTQDWIPAGVEIRRAGVSAFGIGGTNAHVVISEPPASAIRATTPLSQPRLILASGTNDTSADNTIDSLRSWAEESVPSVESVNALWTGRTHDKYRRSFVVDPSSGQLSAVQAGSVGAGDAPPPEQVWLFSGQGAQFPGAAHGLDQQSPTFRSKFNQIAEFFADVEKIDVSDLLVSDRSNSEAIERLRQTSLTQPAIFAFQLALAAVLHETVGPPEAVLGHSIGEFAALVVAGGLSWEDGARCVAARGRLMGAMEPGAMLATRLSEHELKKFLPEFAEIAALNTPNSTVATGPSDSITQLEQILADSGHRSRVLQTSHAFHSAMMESAATEFAEMLQGVSFHPLSAKMLSNVTGDWLVDDDAADPQYWARQMRSPVRFSDCLTKLMGPVAGQMEDRRLLIEIGPGSSLSSFVVAHSAGQADWSEASESICVSLNAADRRQPSIAVLDGLGAMWCAGLVFDRPPDLVLRGQDLDRAKSPAPLSVFDQKPCWLPSRRHLLSPALSSGSSAIQTKTVKPTIREHPNRWLFARNWRSIATPPAGSNAELLVIGHENDLTDQVLEALAANELEVPFLSLADLVDDHGIIDEEALNAALDQMVQAESSQGRKLHVVLTGRFGGNAAGSHPMTPLRLRSNLDSGAHTMLALARALASRSRQRSVQLSTIVMNAFSVVGTETVDPAAAAMLGPTKVIPLEYSGITTRLIDLDGEITSAKLGQLLQSDLTSSQLLAVRGPRLWVPGVAQVERDLPTDDDLPIRQGGHYLLVGGLGGVGLSIASFLAEKFGARLTFTSRSGRPKPDEVNPGDRSTSVEPSESERRLSLLESIEANAEAVTIRVADAANGDDMNAVVSQAVAEYGPIDGVFFGAAVADQGGSIHLRDRDAAEHAIAAKVYGAVALASALEGQHPSFVLLSSSIASELYHNRFGQVGYVTANSYIESFAEARSIACDRLVTVAWDDWTDVGMSVRAAQRFKDDHASAVNLVDDLHSFSPEDGIGIFKRALVGDEPVLFVSTTDLVSRIQRDEFEENPFLAQAIADDDANELDASSVGDAVRQIWTQLLGTHEFGDDDDFFELGGDSLQVARMADRLVQFTGDEIPLDLIFDNSTVKKLTAALGQDVVAGEQLAEHKGPVVLAPAQHRFLKRRSQNPHHFNVSLMLRATTPVSFEHFSDVTNILVSRHDVLRTRFSSVNPGEALQQVGMESNVRVKHIVGPKSTWLDEAKKIQHSLHLVDGPLAAFCLFSESADDKGDGQYVFLLMHHMISDRLSILVLVSEFDRLLAHRGDTDVLGSDPTPFSGWSEAVAEFAVSDLAATENQRWQDFSAKLGQVASLRCFEGVQHRLNGVAASKKLKLSKETSRLVLGGKQGIPQAILLRALGASLSELDDGAGPWESVRIDVLGHGRRQLGGVETSRTLGFFLSYAPVWVRPNSPDQLSDLVEQATANWTFDLFEQELPTIEPAAVLFNFVGRSIDSEPLVALEHIDVDKGPDSLPENVRDHPLAVSAAVDVEGRIEMVFVYPQTAVEDEVIETLSARFEQELERRSFSS